MSRIQLPSDIIQSAAQAQLNRAGANFAEAIAATLGDPITGATKVVDTDKRGLFYIHGLGSEPQSAYTAVNNGLRENELFYGAPVLVKKGVNGFTIERVNPDAAPDFFDGVEARNDQTPVYISQIMYGTLHPYGTDLQLLVIGATYDDDDVNDIITADFSSGTVQDTTPANITIPTTNNTAKGVLVQLDAVNETLSYKQSATYSASIRLRQAYRAGLLPLVDSGKFRIGYFQLVFGMDSASAYTYADIWTVPEILNAGSSLFPHPVTAIYTIPSGYQQVASEIEISAGGELVIDGELFLL